MAVDVFDLLGRHVAGLLDGFLEAGEHDIRADMSGFSSGAYIVRLAAGGHVSTIRMLLIR